MSGYDPPVRPLLVAGRVAGASNWSCPVKQGAFGDEKRPPLSGYGAPVTSLPTPHPMQEARLTGHALRKKRAPGNENRRRWEYNSTMMSGNLSPYQPDVAPTVLSRPEEPTMLEPMVTRAGLQDRCQRPSMANSYVKSERHSGQSGKRGRRTTASHAPAKIADHSIWRVHQWQNPLSNP